ncbi:Tim44/TimA family putative adaptor protein [Tropicimonas sediminicola]|uniref:Predicted lipid-binding transport protein, Tim44 family n=1 Tax=Tropicimonas sediminicola TaxID=1031541 RepID=A0A239KYX8_9RHOB|nr:Tim44/TimA family putative adaptor protein [Tropicimonas sediminicola]SNT23566.1 Predicted lipid-binding transport protein, Tim44 family [Tropicimonas sediminicola]
MSAAVIQLLVLAGIAIFLILRLRSVLGTREGFEKPQLPPNERENLRRGDRPDFEVIDGGPDRDIIDHVPEGSSAALALAQMKRAEPSFSVHEFLQGARGAYEMILMAFEHGELERIEPFLDNDVRDAFAEVIAQREAQGLTVSSNFVGVRELSLTGAEFDAGTDTAEITVRFVGEMTHIVRDAEGKVLEGSETEIKRQRDVWTFARKMGTGDPNWQLVATGE